MSPRERSSRSTGPHGIRVTAIGRCEILLGRTRVRPDSAVLFALLLYLTVRAGARVTRDELLSLLWPDTLDRSRRHSLRQLLYRIRRAGVTLDVDGPELMLNPSEVSTDIGALFSPAWADVVPVKGVPSPRLILPSYRPGLGAEFDSWLEGVRDDAATQIRRACQRHIATGRDEGRWADVEALARICLSCDPLNDDATRALAEATAMAGAQAEALRILDAYLWEIGGQTGNTGHAAKLLRRRIATQPRFHLHPSGEPPLIGRADDLRWLNELRDAVAPGHPVKALLVGPPGIGKTAVARAFTGYAEMRGWQVAVARLQPTDDDRPMSLFLELLPNVLNASGALGAAPESIAQLRRLLGVNTEEGDILAGLSQEPEAIQARIRAAALDLISAVAHEAPLIIVLEDLHWIDASSLRLLSWLVDHGSQLPVLWLLTSRAESRFAALREAFPADRVPSRSLGPLSPREAAELFTAFAPRAKQDSAAAEMAYTATGGNPLYLRELARHWADARDRRLPGSLRTLMSDRIARLSTGSHRVLQSSAILGRLATVPRVASVLQVGTVELLEAVEELDGLGLLGIGAPPGSLALHDLWQEQVVGTMNPSARALLHVRSGEVLLAESEIARTAAIVVDSARHLNAGGATARAIQLLCDATGHQLTNGLTDDAVATSQQAWIIATEQSDKAQCADLYLRALHQAGRWSEILAVGGATNSHREEMRVRHDQAELYALEAMWRTGESPEVALQIALTCAEDPRATDEHRLRACLLVHQAASNLFDPKSLARAHDTAKHLPRASETMSTVGSLIDIIYETELGSVEAAASIANALIQKERQANNHEGLARSLRFACCPQRSLGNYDRALALAVEAHDTAVRHQLAEQAAHSAYVCATIGMERNDAKTAEIWLDRAETWADRVSLSYLRRCGSLLRAEIALFRNDFAEANRLVSQDAADGPMTTAREELSLLSLRCRILVAQGRLAELPEPVRHLGIALERSRCSFLQDPYVLAYVAALKALSNDSTAKAYARQYRDEWRRDRSDLPAELAIGAE